MFSIHQRLSDWPGTCLELRCPCSEQVMMFPIRMLLERGDRSFQDVLRALRCKSCGGKPGPVYLLAGHTRTFNHGPSPDWAVELVPEPVPSSTPARLRLISG